MGLERPTSLAARMRKFGSKEIVTNEAEDELRTENGTCDGIRLH